MDLLERRTEAGEVLTAHPHRVYAYVAIAMYDATTSRPTSKLAGSWDDRWPGSSSRGRVTTAPISNEV
jgi:hypothetical protein